MKKILSSSLFFLVFLTGKAFAQEAGEKAGEKKGWPSAERYAFLTECIGTAKVNMKEDAARFYCWCMQDKVEKKYPTIEEAAKITGDDMQSAEWQKEIKSCGTGSSWASKDRSDFLTNCIQSAKDGIGPDKAKIYCECMLFKLEKTYPDPADANKLTDQDLNSPAWKKVVKSCLDF